MNNLILGVATNYTVAELKPLILSMRRHYKGHAVLFMHNPGDDMIELLVKNNIELVLLPTLIFNGVDICNERHVHYLKYLIEHGHKYDRAFTIDTRDLIFQGDPFAHECTTDLEVFDEGEVYANCNCNGNWWINGIYGGAMFKYMADKKILCAGSTMGTVQGMKLYLSRLLEEIAHMKKVRGPQLQAQNPVVDQPCHGVIIHNYQYPGKYKVHRNGYGPVATMSFFGECTFNDEGYLLNKDGSIPAVVHQWDRVEQHKQHFYDKAIGIK